MISSDGMNWSCPWWQATLLTITVAVYLIALYINLYKIAREDMENKTTGHQWQCFKDFHYPSNGNL